MKRETQTSDTFPRSRNTTANTLLSDSGIFFPRFVRLLDQFFRHKHVLSAKAFYGRVLLAPRQRNLEPHQSLARRFFILLTRTSMRRMVYVHP